MTSTPAYTFLELSPPTTPNALPKEQLNKKIKADHEQNIKQLKRSTKEMKKQQFWVEVAVIDRTFYKLSNSQRLFPRFRIIAQVRQLCKRLKGLAIDQVVARFLRVFWNVASIDNCKGPWNFIPTKELAEYTMHRIIAAALLLDRLQALLMKAYVEQTKTLRLRHFTSLMFVYMGACSRLYCMAHRWSIELQQCYEMIQGWYAAFPSGIKPKDKAKETATNAIDYTCLPDTCAQARRDAIQEWSGQSEIPGILTSTPVKKLKNKNPAVPTTTESTMDTTPLMEGDDLGEVIERPI
ncbi:predicted protein [Lichtheimia corymbifera JMRC:FSU:9682]|uniref:Nucleolus and neural progenitor protein-like N-terminal domain-containing protein n=1 Tax=Lichtheimia corymbifera JMRC:FSU:9682 TaxID=1263082 RepID=A0A068S0M2_9FUNG|nr:predicted protein [Lichtheimia corymbifera JMRC:FSU:9682]